MQAGLAVFFISAVLHEMLVGIPTHALIGLAFVAMMGQIPMVYLTAPFEKWQGQWKVVGNCIFWVTLCLIGQPFAVLFYFYRWSWMYGS